jgi:hypothetical protein
MSGTPTLEEIVRKARSANKGVLRETAQCFLASVELMTQAKSKRWRLAERLFPHFTLPPGWLAVALGGKLKEQEVAQILMDRIKAIETPEDVRRERDFLRVFIVEEPATANLAYRRILSGSHLDDVLRVARLLPRAEAPSVIRRIHLEVVARNRHR